MEPEGDIALDRRRRGFRPPSPHTPSQCQLPGGSISAPVCHPSVATVADTVLEAALALRVSECEGGMSE